MCATRCCGRCSKANGTEPAARHWLQLRCMSVADFTQAWKALVIDPDCLTAMSEAMGESAMATIMALDAAHPARTCTMPRFRLCRLSRIMAYFDSRDVCNDRWRFQRKTKVRDDRS